MRLHLTRVSWNRENKQRYQSCTPFYKFTSDANRVLARYYGREGLGRV